jgi:hypothetical protein
MLKFVSGGILGAVALSEVLLTGQFIGQGYWACRGSAPAPNYIQTTNCRDTVTGPCAPKTMGGTGTECWFQKVN